METVSYLLILLSGKDVTTVLVCLMVIATSMSVVSVMIFLPTMGIPVVTVLGFLMGLIHSTLVASVTIILPTIISLA